MLAGGRVGGLEPRPEQGCSGRTVEEPEGPRGRWLQAPLRPSSEGHAARVDSGSSPRMGPATPRGHSLSRAARWQGQVCLPGQP